MAYYNYLGTEWVYQQGITAISDKRFNGGIVGFVPVFYFVVNVSAELPLRLFVFVLGCFSGNFGNWKKNQELSHCNISPFRMKPMLATIYTISVKLSAR